MDYRKSAKDFIMPDVTEALFEVMREGEDDGRRLAKLDKRVLKSFISLSHIKRIGEFVKQVGGGSDFDLKSKPEWNSPWYYFDGYILRFDDPGNIVYGIILMEAFKEDYTNGMFMERELEAFGHVGAGAAQILDNVIKPAFKFNFPGEELGGFYDEFGYLRDGSLKNAVETLLNIRTSFDDPRDYAAVELGYEYYGNKRYN